jgi:Mlc titration factor MtfA (ptsG expression regulator)/Tfp pilus assembly protein PilF
MFFPFGRRGMQRGAFPEGWLPLLRDNVLLYHTLAEDEQERLRDQTRTLVAGKLWEGCAGQVITDEVKVTIAGQAALLLLGLNGYYFDELRTVLVYPGGFLSELEDELGHQAEVEMRLGEAADGGPVVLSWWHARWGGRRLGSVNVVLHEFAHKLAELGDAEAGRPPLVDRALARRWDRVIRAECERLAEDSDYGRPTLLDPYGGSSPSEFFAVATETFFLQPVPLRARHPEVYELLAGCYRQDPASRPVPAGVAATARESEEEYSRQAIAECTAALEHRPDYTDAYRERAEHRWALGDIDGALADWAAVAARLGGQERAEALYERGGVLREAGRLDEALADLTQAIRLCPELGVAHADRGAIHAERGERAQALADLDEAIRLDPRDDGAWLERALVHADAGDLERALKDLDRAVQLSPHDADILRQRAEVYEDMGRTDNAQRDRAAADGLEGTNVTSG